MENDDNILKDCLGSSVNVGVWLVMTFAAYRNGHDAGQNDRPQSRSELRFHIADTRWLLVWRSTLAICVQSVVVHLWDVAPSQEAIQVLWLRESEVRTISLLGAGALAQKRHERRMVDIGVLMTRTPAGHPALT
jgi:hypothetical protein